MTCAAMALQGCIAAAIPLAAGGLVVRGAGSADRQAATTATDAPSVTVDTTPEAAVAGVARLELDRLPPADRAARPITLAEVTPEVSADGTARLPAASDGFPGFDRYQPLYDYVQRLTEQEAGVTQSAILRDPASLEPGRAECSAGAPTVLIDLDPEGALLDPYAILPDQPVLASRLAQLRSWGVTIAWISGHSAALAGDIRTALEQAGLDPEGSDQLVLLRYPLDRKQTRRREFAKGVCVIAIAGDTRSDFDELFDYVVDPASTAFLEPIIGRGWFLVPPLFPPQGSSQ